MLRESAEMIPIEPDADNADAGRYDITEGKRRSPYSMAIAWIRGFFFSDCFHQKHFREILIGYNKKEMLYESKHQRSSTFQPRVSPSPSATPWYLAMTGSRRLSQREQTSSSSRRFVEDDEIIYKL